MKRLTLSLVLSFAPACGSESGVARASDVSEGAAIFQDASAAASPYNEFACADCHPTPGAGSTRTFPGADLAGAIGRPSYWGGQEREILRAINYCRAFFMRAPEPWSAEDQSARALYAYLASLSGSADPAPFTPVREIVPPPCAPADREAGERVFASACQYCHGSAHEGQGRRSKLIPVLPEQTLEHHALDGPCETSSEASAIFLSKIRHGGFFYEGGNMPPFSRETLSDSDVANLFAFLGLGPNP